jgi:hypothetical protein
MSIAARWRARRMVCDRDGCGLRISVASGREVSTAAAPWRNRGLFAVVRIAVIVLALGSVAAGAEPADYVLVEGSDATLRANLAWLNDRRVVSLPLATWPLPVKTIREAIASRSPGTLDAADRAALDQVEATLARLQATMHAYAAINTGQHPELAGEDPVRGMGAAGIGVQGGSQSVGGRLMLSGTADALGNASGAVPLLDGSYGAVEGLGLMLWAGLLDQHWGPGVFGSPLLSYAALPVPTLALRRVSDSAPETSWLSWIGPWGFQFSLGQLQNYEPADTMTMGLRFYLRPLAGLEIGFGRSILWAGSGRPKGLGAFWDTLLGRTNPDRANDPSNELSGIDVRYAGLTDAGSAVVVYGQLIGEDVSDFRPIKYIGTVGAQYKHLRGDSRLEWTLEATDTVYERDFQWWNQYACSPAYRHDQYTGGYFHMGLPLGAAVGGGALGASLGLAWVPLAPRWVERVSAVLTWSRVNECGPDVNNAAFTDSGILRAFSIRVQGSDAQRRWYAGVSVQSAPGEPRPVASLQAGVEFAFPAR